MCNRVSQVPSYRVVCKARGLRFFLSDQSKARTIKAMIVDIIVKHGVLISCPSKSIKRHEVLSSLRRPSGGKQVDQQQRCCYLVMMRDVFPGFPQKSTVVHLESYAEPLFLKLYVNGAYAVQSRNAPCNRCRSPLPNEREGHLFCTTANTRLAQYYKYVEDTGTVPSQLSGQALTSFLSTAGATIPSTSST